MAERVAVLENQNHDLKGDTENIRARMHDFANHMQVFVRNEEACGAAIRQVSADNQAQNAILDKLTVAVETLTATKDHAAGVWWAIVRVCAVVSGALGLLGGIAALIGWLLVNHVSLRVG